MATLKNAPATFLKWNRKELSTYPKKGQNKSSINFDMVKVQKEMTDLTRKRNWS